MNKIYKIVMALFVGLKCFSVQAMQTPEQRLMQAAYQNDLGTVRHCIEQEGVDVNAKRHAGYYDSPWVKKLVFHDWISRHDVSSGSTALQYAAEAGSTAVVKYLLSLPDIDIDCASSRTGALYRAILYNNFDIAYELLKAGADYTKAISGPIEKTARDIALKQGKQGQRIVQLIDALELYKPQLFAALEQNDEEQVRLLLQKVPYWVKDEQGNTLLHKAVEHCNPELVGLILKLDTAAITKQNRQGQTPIDRALLCEKIDLIELFTKLAYAQPEPANYSEDPCVAPVTCQIL